MQRHQEKIYKTQTTGRFCPKCNERFTRQFCFELHLSKCLGVPLPSCIKCGKQFSSKTSMYRHRKDCKIELKSEFDGNLQKNCPKCQKCFKEKLCYDIHISKCLGTPRPKCANCGKIYSSRSSMYRHKNTCSEKNVSNIGVFVNVEYVNDWNQEYDISQPNYANEDDFAEFYEEEDIEEKYSTPQLETSNQSFSTMDFKTQELTDEKYCPKCKECFKKQLCFDLHLSKCLGKPRPKCNICGIIFNSAATMYRHKKTCKEKNFSKNDYNSQITVEEKYCPKCFECFQKQLCYDLHLSKCIGAVSPKCKNCGKIFYSRTTMYRHMKNCTYKNISTVKKTNHIEYANSDEERLDKILSISDTEDDDSVQLIEADDEKDHFEIRKTNIVNVYRLNWRMMN